MRRGGKLILGCALVLVSVGATLSLFTPAEAKPPSRCDCPATYAPVWCKTKTGAARFDNLCLAQCAGATECVPVPIFPS